jgi:hypothetical protein
MSAAVRKPHTTVEGGSSSSKTRVMPQSTTKMAPSAIIRRGFRRLSFIDLNASYQRNMIVVADNLQEVLA